MIRLLRTLFPGRGRRRSADRCRELEREVGTLNRMLLDATLASCQDRVYLTLANEALAADREQLAALHQRAEREARRTAPQDQPERVPVHGQPVLRPRQRARPAAHPMTPARRPDVTRSGGARVKPEGEPCPRPCTAQCPRCPSARTAAASAASAPRGAPDGRLPPSSADLPRSPGADHLAHLPLGASASRLRSSAR